MDIKRIGAYQEVDAQGYLQSIADASNIQGEWLGAVQALKRAYLERWPDIHSLYIRGSLAKGWPVRGVSDIDSFAVMKPTWKNTVTYDVLEAWALNVERMIQATFPFVAGVEVGLEAYNGMFDRENIYAFIVKTQAACIYGEDLAEAIDPYKLDHGVAFQTQYFQEHLEVFLEAYPEESAEEKAAWLTWLMRRFLRLGMELVMAKEQRYTRDLYLCYETFAKHYPEQKGEMYRVLELAINPQTGQETERFIAEFGAWLVKEAERCLTRWREV